MRRIFFLIYGLVAYVMFLAVFAYAMGFVGGIGVPKSIDSTPTSPLGWAILVNSLLLGVFAIQHSVMARPAFKRWWTKFIPQPIERATYVIASNVAMIALFIWWQPMGGAIWDIQEPVARTTLHVLFVIGWLGVPAVSLLINHFDLFGLRQVWLYYKGQPYTHLPFRTPMAYRYVRHPLYVAWLLAFWCTPTMTAAHLLFAVLTTAYIFVAIQFEERDLIESHGKLYTDYRRTVPMIVPHAPRPEPTAPAAAG